MEQNSPPAPGAFQYRHQTPPGKPGGVKIKKNLFGQIILKDIELMLQLLRKSVLKLGIEFLNALGLLFPELLIHIQNALQRLAGNLILNALKIDVLRFRDKADRRLNRVNLALAAVDDPLQDTEVVAKARPQELAVVTLAEPVDIEDLGSFLRIEALADINPVLPVIPHVITTEREHRHRVTADNADCASGGGGSLRSHDRAYKYAVVPITGLIDQRSELRTAASEYKRGDWHTVRVFKLRADARAVDSRSGEAAIGMRAFLLAGLAVPRIALPVDCVGRRILIQTFPPDGVIIQIVRNIGKDGAFLRGGKGIRVGLVVRAGGNAKEAVLRVDSIQTAVRALADPGDIIADTPDLVSLLEIALRRDQHGQIGLTAGGRERRTDILDLMLRVLNAKDDHMLGIPEL